VLFAQDPVAASQSALMRQRKASNQRSVGFSLGGTRFEIDLIAGHAGALRDALARSLHPAPSQCALLFANPLCNAQQRRRVLIKIGSRREPTS
jgi:hypothetical protein